MPGQQQPWWYWLCAVRMLLSSLEINFSNLCQSYVEELHEMQIYFYVVPEKFCKTRVQVLKILAWQRHSSLQTCLWATTVGCWPSGGSNSHSSNNRAFNRYRRWLIWHHSSHRWQDCRLLTANTSRHQRRPCRRHHRSDGWWRTTKLGQPRKLYVYDVSVALQ